MILADLVLGNDNPWSELYDANRPNVRGAATMFVRENAKVARHWVGDRLAHTDAPDIQSVPPGEGALVSLHGERIAAYRDEAGNLHTLSPVCTHLACLVNWNHAHKSWDCRWHGSRFTGEGTLIQGPAARNWKHLGRSHGFQTEPQTSSRIRGLLPDGEEREVLSTV